MSSAKLGPRRLGCLLVSEVQAKLILQMREQLNQILSDHTGQDVDKVASDTDRDFWMLAEEAKAYGAIDEILSRRELAAVTGEGS